MSIKLGQYSFDGPYPSIAKIKGRSGLYVIVCKIESEYYLLDVGESSNLKKGIENQDKKECWIKKCKGQLSIYVHYSLFLKQEGRILAEQELREMYHPACEADKKVWFPSA